MGFDDYDNWWSDLEAVGKKYGYQIGLMTTIDFEEDTIVVKFHKISNCISCDKFGDWCKGCAVGDDD